MILHIHTQLFIERDRGRRYRLPRRLSSYLRGMATPVIQLDRICKSYRNGGVESPVLQDVSLAVQPGELLAIMGPSGSGKSTLLNILGLLDTWDTGVYRLNGEDMRGLGATRAARLRNQLLGFVFQSFNLLTDKTVLENVSLPLYHQGVPRRERNDRARQYLAKFGMEGYADRYPNQLSGGQKQRVAIARALATHPKVILADEPTGALDSQNSRDVMQILKEINAEGVTVLIITHDPEVARQARRVIRIMDGRIQPQEMAPAT